MKAAVVYIKPESDAYSQKALTLSQKTGVPMLESEEHQNARYCIEYGSKGLVLLDLQKNGLGPLRVDFTSHRMAFRRSSGKELLRKALGIKGENALNVLDATAGLATDSFLIACMGNFVTLVEQSPVVYALVWDAMERALASEAEVLVRDAINRMQLLQADSLEFMQNIMGSDRYDVVYLDPMFPERKKNAKVKKEMQYLQEIVSQTDTADKLLAAGLGLKVRRVVVKRPPLAPALPGPKPRHCVKSKAVRFDIYMP